MQPWLTVAADLHADPLAGILGRADADTLTTLAGFFEAQAARLRDAARAATVRAADAERAREARARSKADYLRVGARLNVLTRRYAGNRDAAISEMRNRTGWSAYVIEDIAAKWRREKKRRATLKRNTQIFREKLRGDREAEIAARHDLTARQIRAIYREVAAALHRSNQTALFASMRP